jgi:hypothetical protein
MAEREGSFLFLKNKHRFQISDGKTTKTPEHLLENSDIGNVFYMLCTIGSAPTAPAKNSDPGRVRSELLLSRCTGTAKRVKSVGAEQYKYDPLFSTCRAVSTDARRK